jgi:hypothetical protein
MSINAQLKSKKTPDLYRIDLILNNKKITQKDS